MLAAPGKLCVLIFQVSGKVPRIQSEGWDGQVSFQKMKRWWRSYRNQCEMGSGPMGGAANRQVWPEVGWVKRGLIKAKPQGQDTG